MPASTHSKPDSTEHAPPVQPVADAGGGVAERRQRHWHSTQRLTAALLSIWFVVTFVIAFEARGLSAAMAGWPFSFWVAAQGAPIVYVLLVGWYARRMYRIDLENGLAEDDTPATSEGRHP